MKNHTSKLRSLHCSVTGLSMMSALVISITSGESRAATLLGYWDFNDNPRGAGPTFNQTASMVAGVTVSGITADGGLRNGTYGTNASVYGVGGSSDRPFFFESNSVGNSESGALTGGGNGTGPDTFSFTVTPTSGGTINLTTLSFYAWSRVSPGTSGSYSFFVRSSATGSTTLGTYTSANFVASDATPTSANNQYTLDLSSIPALTGVSTPVTFTIGVYYSGGTGNNLRLDDVRLSGDVIPEPALSLLSALGLIPLLRRRR